MKSEIELKFFPVVKDEMRAKLKAAGFTLARPEFLMKRVVFHIPDCSDTWGRVRQESDRVTMSIKQNTGYGLTDTKEVELAVDSFDNAIVFMEAAGFHRASYQETLREVWRNGDVEADMDQWPGLDPWIELESDSEDTIHETCKALGFDEKDAMYGSSDFVYEKVYGISKDVVNNWPEITFANPPVK
jgi:adenylate cyclase class 2